MSCEGNDCCSVRHGHGARGFERDIHGELGATVPFKTVLELHRTQPELFQTGECRFWYPVWTRSLLPGVTASR